ncbi:MAG: hypothetical protein AVDCRST_MAG68-3428 [uncultured Gemmatimonadetes bacterium]|uniref:Uncharacterized protein n=1 Tax=uncultured Gemmatimonadota bacterium TaxID=203437 RepID=A0A6J4LNA3_9BACT|nr:MAG: hypothetical protein AVDCRST_MAG68-3428 [uncultured Gemmatimonadota bacterium]
MATRRGGRADDRLLHHYQIVKIRGNSYRMPHRAELRGQHRLLEGDSASASSPSRRAGKHRR